MARKVSNSSKQGASGGARRFNQKNDFRDSQHVIQAQQQNTRHRVLTRCHLGFVFGLVPYNAPSAVKTRQGILHPVGMKEIPSAAGKAPSHEFSIEPPWNQRHRRKRQINSVILPQANPAVYAVWFCWRDGSLAVSAQSASWLSATGCAQKPSQNKTHARRCPRPKHHRTCLERFPVLGRVPKRPLGLGQAGGRTSRE